MGFETWARIIGGLLVLMAPLGIVVSAWVQQRREKAQRLRAAQVASLHADIAETAQAHGTEAAHRLVQMAYRSELNALDALQQAQAAKIADDPMALAKFVQGVIDEKQA